EKEDSAGFGGIRLLHVLAASLFDASPTSILLLIVIKIYIFLQEFSLDCYFRQKWLDRRLAFTPINPDKPVMPLASKMLKDIWVPDTYIRNGRKSYLHTLTVPNILFRVRSDGQVHVSQRLTIKTKCLMFLRKFPMDVQACPIEIGSLGYFTNDLVYYWKDVDLDAKMGNMLSQYKILGLIKSEHNYSDHRLTHRSELNLE
ncbi:Neurotransmitter-gated ion-channel ligand binding domain protein, partial [Cooperia oncophora]